MRFLLRLVALVVFGVAVVWLVQYVDTGRERVRAEGALRGAVEKVGGAAEKVGSAVDDLDVSAISAELEETGRVVRRKAGHVVGQVADATRDGRTSAAIKAKLALDPSLSALDVSVDTTDGRVTLAGRVDSPAEVARAIEIAFEQDDVYEVVSTLQVRPGEPAPTGGR